MSKINAVRFINLNYNDDTVKVNDESMYFNGKSTLVSLQNGGGKTVLVQMMTAPFVHRSKQKSNDRPFESYFSTAKPTFILVEWLLDEGAGYVLTGLMVRKNQEISEDKTDALEMMTIISEYKESCLQDISHLPVVEKDGKTMHLKSYHSCKKLFEDYKKDKSIPFFCYDMSSPGQTRQYFYKLMEYQINYKEWETIMRRVNTKESGLSELFKDCKNERELLDKWFLEAIENKLNKDENQIKNFQRILEKYAGKYKNIKEQLKKRDAIRKFKEEAEEIRISADDFIRKEQEKERQQEEIAAFINQLNTLCEEAGKEWKEERIKKEKLQEELALLRYEELSSEFHDKDRERILHASNRDMIDLEIEDLIRKYEAIQRKLNIFCCARQQQTVDEDKKEWEVRKERVSVASGKNENLEPERNKIGSLLNRYYKKQIEANKEKEKNTKNQKIQIKEDISRQKENLKKYQKKAKKVTENKGALRSLVRNYYSVEERYNARYKENLFRNILGVYEPGMLEIKQEMYNQEMKKIIRDSKENKIEFQNTGEEIHRKERALDEKKEQYYQKKSEVKQAKEEKDRYKQELEKREDILKYLELPQEKLFDKDEILYTARTKMEELEERKRNLEKKKEAMQKEYRLLASGRLVELPESLKEEFERFDIPVIYGMEWLKKNGFTEEKNKEIVKKNPFLPYSLILTQQELKKLSEMPGEIYTSFPIPVIEREKIESIKLNVTNPLIEMQNIHFYILFNENLLNEQKMQEMMVSIQKDIQAVKESIQICKREYEDYFHRYDIIKGQKVTEKIWKNAEKILQKLEEEQRALSLSIKDEMESLNDLKTFSEKIRKHIQKLEQEIVFQKNRAKEFEELQKEYSLYKENNQKLQEYIKEEEQLENRQQITGDIIFRLEEKYREIEGEENNLFREGETLQSSYQKFIGYQDEYDHKVYEPLEQENVLKLEARYEAITSQISQELKELEIEEEKALTRYHKSLEELEEYAHKYRLRENEWRKVIYDKKEELHQEANLEEYDNKIKRRKNLSIEEDKKVGILISQLEGISERIKSECQKEKPLEQEKIRQKDLESAKNQTMYQIRESDKKEESLNKAVQRYNENLTALAQYRDFQVNRTITFEQDFRKMNDKELRNFQGILLRDYKSAVEATQRCRENLAQILNKMARQEIFQDVSYKIPLENMLKICDDASKVLKQLNITIESYDSLMKQLEVDISLVEAEKKNVTELLEDYVQNIHKNLGKIGANSTIKIKEKPIRMLRLILPSWEDNEKLYHIRLSDFVDEITEEGIKLFENNKNAQEYIGRKVTSKNLYDQVVGTGNVQIRIYKIESQREQQISWSQVVRNSGGEGFLSAFVILSSLLDYMRKDDSDIFINKNEGKVLLMDNPFAQTSSDHLLKPLMTLAEKTNTQLICLTALGDEAIYNSFDNIYVLNLVAAHLRKGIQYLHSNHKKGEEKELETILPSQIEVEF